MPQAKKGKTTPLTYAETGVQYDILDPVKKLSQQKAIETRQHLMRFAMREVTQSRGESAYVWEEKDSYRAFVLECLGSKNLVADETRRITGKTYYDAIAQDTVAMAVNDITAVGASPLVVNAYFSLGDSAWLNDQERTTDLINGWARACSLAGSVWGGGETPTIRGVTYPETINLAASCVGIIKPKKRLTLGEKLTSGDRILLIESSGIHANGVSLARAIAQKLPEGYATRLSDKTLFGEALLKPTYIYAQFIDALFAAGISVHYMSNITGHGFRKLMRATQAFTYVISSLPRPHPVFQFLQQHSGNTDKEMYGNFNMGAGFALFLPPNDCKKAQKIATKFSFQTVEAGYLESGRKEVIIQPLDIVFSHVSLNVR